MTSPEDQHEATILTAILRHFAWAPVGKVPGVYEVWSPTEQEAGIEEVVVPLDPSRGDYRALVNKAERQMQWQYGRAVRDVSAVLRMQSAASLDSTFWKKETPVEAGLISWPNGERLYEAARAQLIASAKAAKEARRYHGNASSYVAKRFLDATFMGQTEVGSFVITAYLPSQQVFHVSRNSEESVHISPQRVETLSGSEILSTFEGALKAVRAGLEDYKRTPRIEPFLEMVSDGVSYEFTSALSKITEDGDSEIEVVREGDGQGERRRTQVAFEAVESPILERIANVFAQDPEPQEVTVRGEVTLLSRSSEVSDRVIRLHIYSGASVRKARIHLSAEQYDVAMEAHRTEVPLRVSGRLEKQGNLYWIYSPTNVAIIQDVHPPHERETLFDLDE